MNDQTFPVEKDHNVLFRVPTDDVLEIRVLPSGYTVIYLTTLVPIMFESGEICIEKIEGERGLFIQVSI